MSKEEHRIETINFPISDDAPKSNQVGMQLLMKGVHPKNIIKLSVITDHIEPVNINNMPEGTFPSTAFMLTALLTDEGVKEMKENMEKPIYWTQAIE